MHNLAKRIAKIYEIGSDTEKEMTTDDLEKIICIAKSADHDTMKYYATEIRTRLEKELNMEMIHEVITTPYWSEEQVNEVLTAKGLNVRLEDAYFLANYYYHCYKDIMSEDIILAMTIKDINKAMWKWKEAKMK